MKKEIPNLNEEDINKAISYAFHKPIGKKYEKLNAELKKYNELVNKAISNRERFLDANMKYFAEFEVPTARRSRRSHESLYHGFPR